MTLACLEVFRCVERQVEAPAVGTVVQVHYIKRRAVIIVDEQGVVRYRHVHRLGLDFQTVDEIRAALDDLAPQAGMSAEEAPH